MRNKIKKWLDKGEGGQFYEPYVTNGDVIILMMLTMIVSVMIILGCLIV
jgi:hypothetical protein